MHVKLLTITKIMFADDDDDDDDDRKVISCERAEERGSYYGGNYDEKLSLLLHAVMTSF
jgi:hypothetical protein